MKKHRPFWALWGRTIEKRKKKNNSLITALVSDTWGDWWSWVGLGIPVAVMGWYGRPRAPGPTPPAQSPRAGVER